MSLKTWKNEFNVKTGNLVKDGLRKWLGVRACNLKKHGCKLIASNASVADQHTDESGVAASSRHPEGYAFYNLSDCGLCTRYLYASACVGCPIDKAVGSCIVDNDDHPYQIFDETGDPEPMIKLLEKL